MDTREKHIRENESEARRETRAEEQGYLDAAEREAKALRKRRKNETVKKNNKLWLWLGVLILIFILLWWLWSIGTFEDMVGVANG